MPNDPMLPLPGLSPVSGKSVVAKFDGGLLSSNGGVLALREVEKAPACCRSVRRLHSEGRRVTEVNVGVHVLNRMLEFECRSRPRRMSPERGMGHCARIPDPCTTASTSAFRDKLAMALGCPSFYLAQLNRSLIAPANGGN